MTTEGRDDLDLGSLAELTDEVERRRAAGERIVLTNGCFDLLHPGHVDGLRRARSLGDCLVVAVNGDESVRRLKGAGRPIVAFAERRELLLALRWVDLVIGFDADTPLEIIHALRPDVWVKGADWRDTDTPEARAVREGGGEIVYLDLVDGYSTTSLVERIRALPLTE
jgi:D-beta-D-heptose 7-phosphate kinase/D-beta-D-heptose 1-phosphate adenosyltransferase